jgi:hypothetical protein
VKKAVITINRSGMLIQNGSIRIGSTKSVTLTTTSDTTNPSALKNAIISLIFKEDDFLAKPHQLGF